MKPAIRFSVLLILFVLSCEKIVTQTVVKEKTVEKEVVVNIHDGYSLSVEFDHKNRLYDIGEKVVATISFTHNGEPVQEEMTIEVSMDNYLPTVQKSTVRLGEMPYVMELSVDQPGFLMVKATCKIPDGPTVTKIGSAGICIYDIKRSLEEPEDFVAYWEGQKALQRALPDDLILTPVTTTVAGVTAYDVQATCLAGPFSAYLAIPEDAQRGRLPAMVLCHGAGVASSRLSVAAQWASRGIITLDFNVHGLQNGLPQEYYSALGAQGGELFQYYLNGTESRENIFFRYMILRLVKAMDVVTAREEWDGENLIVYGRSQGGGQSIIASGIDDRVKLICAEIPALCDMTGYKVGRASGWPRYESNYKNGLTPEQESAIRYIDAMNFAAHSKAKTYFTVGFIDVTCPPTSVLAAYNTIPAEKHILHNLYTGHVTTPEGEAYVSEAVDSFLKSIRQ